MLKSVHAAAAFLVLIGVADLRAGDNPDAAAIVEKAVIAHGGKEMMSKIKAVTWKSVNTLTNPRGGAPMVFNTEASAQLPDQIRFEMRVKDKVMMLTAMSHNKGWMQMGNGSVNKMSPNQIKEQKEELHANLLATVLPILDKANTLTVLPETKVNNRPAVGIKVASKDHRDVDLYFDKNNGLLIKMERIVKQQQGGKEVKQETTYGDYKEIKGVKFPMKAKSFRDGKQFMEENRTEWTPVEKLDEKLFDEP